MKKCAAMLLVVALLAGCIGSFGLTRKLWNWNKDQGEKVTQEVVYLLFNILPVYGITTFVDFFIINTIEFWTDENPVDAASLSQGGTTLALFKQGDGTLRLETAQGTLVLQADEDGVTASSLEGEVLYSARTGADGRIEVYHGQKLAMRYAPGSGLALAAAN